MIQHGSTVPRRDMPNTTWVEFMSFEELVSTMAKAESVVCHAGVGTIMTALKNGHTAVVIPRQASHNEHVDDHQMDIATRFAERALVRCVTTEADLAPLLVLRSADGYRRLGHGSSELRRRVLDAAAGEPLPLRGHLPDWPLSHRLRLASRVAEVVSSAVIRMRTKCSNKVKGNPG